MHWREALPELVASGSYRTQGALVRALQEATGRRVNQATMSRELQTLGAEKVDGVYRLPLPPELGAPVHSFVVTGGGCLVVVKTDPAFANVIGSAIDNAALAGVVGTVAGDDTVFIATTGEASLPGLRRFLGVEDRRPVA